MQTFTDHVQVETKASTATMGKLKIEMENIEKRTKRNLVEHNKSVEKLKSEVKKAENEGITAINTLSNAKLTQLKSDLNDAQELTDKLNGTKTITEERKKEINNLMMILSNRLEGLTDKFDENISIISDNEKMNTMKWMEKRREFMKSDTSDQVVQQMINIKKELETALDAAKKERILLTEEREHLEGDRHAFYQWWDSLKETTKPANNNRHFTFDNQDETDTATNVQDKHETKSTLNSIPEEQYSGPLQAHHVDDNYQVDINLKFTFKDVDKHDNQPARSPMHGKVDQEAPQPNQQVYAVDHFTPEQFPPHVLPPLKDGTPIIYDYNVFKCHGHINYKDNLPTYISDTWFYDIRTTNGVKLTNCSGRYVNTNEETVPTTVYGASTRVHNPYKKKAPTVVNPYKKRDSTSARSTNNNKYEKPWIQQEKQLGPHEFVFPLNTAPISVKHHELIKYGNKLNLTINSKDEFRQFYEDFRHQLKTYNIFIVEYDKVEIDKSLAELTPETCENYNVAIREMSRAIFQFFSFNKDTVFATYDAPIHSLDTYRPSGNGFKFLMNLMKRIHPRLKRNVVELGVGLIKMPCFDEYATIHKFINALVVYRQDELQNGRTYNHKELLLHIASSLDERFETATEIIKKELKIAFANPRRPIPIPEYLAIDSELAITIIDMLDNEEKQRDLTNHNPTSRSSATINRLDNRQSGNAKYSKEYNQKQTSNKKFDKQSSRNNAQNNKWAEQLEWKIIEGAECPGCKRSNHNVYSTGCPAFAQFAICQDFYNKCPPKQLEQIKTKFIDYQRERRNQMKDRKRTGRATLRKFEDKGIYDKEDMAQVKLAFFECYKDDFKEEQFLDMNPFDNIEDNDDEDKSTEEEMIEV